MWYFIQFLKPSSCDLKIYNICWETLLKLITRKNPPTFCTQLFRNLLKKNEKIIFLYLGNCPQSESTMPLLYSVISRGTTVLARFANFAGNFSEVTEQVLAQIGPDDSKMTYSHGSYLFHYISEDKIIYLCISDYVPSIIVQFVIALFTIFFIML